MAQSIGTRDSAWWAAYWTNFLGEAPPWYKWTIVGFLVVNPVLYLLFGGYYAGWVLVLQFIFTLAMALKCYPLQPGGLLAIEALLLGMTTPDHVGAEVLTNWQVLLLLVFMVAGIYFMKELLLFTFTKLLVNVRSKAFLSVLFCFVAAILSAFLDALTVTAVVISVAVGFYGVYHRIASGGVHLDADVPELHREDLDQFRAFLRNLVMHAAVGTALGGVTTIVGEPQNILIAERMGWVFMEFFYRMAPVTMPVLVVGLATCLLLERVKWFGYGATIPPAVLEVLQEYDAEESEKRTRQENARLVVQGIAAMCLVFALDSTSPRSA